MTPTQAIKVTLDELGKDPNLRIVAVSGPGEPLACPQTFKTLRGIKALNVDIDFCLSTNGVLLEEKTKQLVELGARTISVTMSTVFPETAAQIYEWAMIDGKRLTGPEMGEKIIDAQLRGISSATKSGVFVKVNSILIPEMNGKQMEALAEALRDAGARLQNIVPLIPFDNMMNERPPTQNELEDARNRASRFMEQFYHCKQCRSDVVGIPGTDRIL
jgi:nitrogen fixation protein NifB